MGSVCCHGAAQQQSSPSCPGPLPAVLSYILSAVGLPHRLRCNHELLPLGVEPPHLFSIASCCRESRLENTGLLHVALLH